MASLGYIALFLFLSISKLKGIIFGFLALIGFFANIAVTHHVAPYVLDIVVFSGAAQNFLASNTTMLTQLRAYGLVTLPLLAILLLHSTGTFLTGPSTAPSSTRSHGRLIRLNLKDPRAPLLSPSPDYFWHCFACSLTVIVFILGKHPGIYLSYHFHSISPFLVIETLAIVSRAVKLKTVSQLLVFAAFYTSYAFLTQDFSVISLKNWQKLEQTIASAEKVYGTTIILGTILENGGEIYHTVIPCIFSWHPRSPRG